MHNILLSCVNAANLTYINYNLIYYSLLNALRIIYLDKLYRR